MIDRSRGTKSSKTRPIDSKLLQRKLSFADNLVNDEQVKPPLTESSSLGLMTPDLSARWTTDTPPHEDKMVVDNNSPLLTQAMNHSIESSDGKCVSPTTPISTPLARHSACPNFVSMYDIRQVQLPITPQKPSHRRNSYSLGGKPMAHKPSYSSKAPDRSMIKHKLKRIQEIDRGKPTNPSNESDDIVIQAGGLSQTYINRLAGSQSLFNTQNDGLSQSYSQFTQPLTFPQHGYFADFHETSLLGSGNFGKVYAVERRLDGLKFAVKQILDVDALSPSRAKKIQEICTMGMASNGMHIVQLHHAWTEGDGRKQTIFIMMELCPGGSLYSHFHNNEVPNQENSLETPVTTEIQVVDVLGQLALALYACHSRNIAHCDLKLENVLYDSTGRLKLGDFGLAVFLDPVTRQPTPFRQQSDTAEDSPRGEPMTSFTQDDGDARYISLDMLNERNHYREGDIFALGMCMYEIMSGNHLPKNGQEFSDLRTTDLVSRRLNEKRIYREPLVNIVSQMVDADPTKRPGINEILLSTIFQDIKHEMRWPRSSWTSDQVSFLKTVSEIEMVSYDIPQ